MTLPPKVEYLVSNFSLSHLPDASLLQKLPLIAARDRATTAELLAHLAEAESRDLFAAAGYPSMLAYCIRHLKYSEPAAERRLHAARVARAYPVFFEMLVDGRMSLTTVLVLSPHLKGADAESLIAEAAGKSRSEIEYLLARRAPRSECFEWGTQSTDDTVTDRVTDPAPARGSSAESGAPASESAAPSGKATLRPLSADRVALQVTVSRSTQEKLQRAKELLGFEVPAHDTAEVLDRALDALIHALEKQRFGKHTKHRTPALPAQDPRHIPSAMREEVASRDGEQCTFVSDQGHRCESRHALQYDHIVPLAQGGVTRVDNLRLLCPAHNQYEADRRLGRQFMEARRRGARPLVNHELKRQEFEGAADVKAALITLGYRKEEVFTAMEFAAGLPAAMTAPERVKAILRQRKAQPQTAVAHST